MMFFLKELRFVRLQLKVIWFSYPIFFYHRIRLSMQDNHFFN